MVADIYQIEEYVTDSGRSPFRSWLDGLRDKQTKAIIQARIFRVRKGLLGDCKSVGKGVMELRISHGPGFRIYFGIKGETLVVILMGGDKKTQPMDIKRAQKYWEDYQGSMT